MQINLATAKISPLYNFKLMLLLFSLLIVMLGIGLFSGYSIAYWRMTKNQGSLIAEWDHYLKVDRHRMQDLEQQTKQHLQVLTHYTGKIEANLIRINSLGKRLVDLAELDPREFNFDQQTVFDPQLSPTPKNEDLSTTLKELDAVLDRRFTQMNTLHLALQSRLGKEDLALSGQGKPVNGWISSFFGTRSDPITGRKAWHAGIDIVAEEGSEVKALAGGVVSFADEKGGYGSMVEINHGNGLATRYGHNKALLVRPGQLVRKGQVIALLGSSGRSTGPHVHLEVHKNGEAVDPARYFSDLKKIN